MATRERLAPGRLPPPRRAHPRRATTPTRTSAYTKELLEREDRHPRVAHAGLPDASTRSLGGIDEAIAILRECAGRAADDGEWAPAGTSSRSARCYEGDDDRAVRAGPDDRGRLLALRPPRDRLPRLRSRAARSSCATSGGRRGGERQADLLLPRPPRPLARADRRRLGGARRGRDRRLDRRAGLVVGRARDRHRPARADRGLRRRHGRGGARLRRPLRRRDERHRARRLRERLAAHRASRSPTRSAPTCGACGWTRASTLVDRSLWRRDGHASSRPASTRAWSRRSARARRGRPRAACGSSSPAASRPSGSASSRRLGVPVDAYGVGLVAHPRRQRLHGRRRAGRRAGRARRSAAASGTPRA